MSRIVNGFKNPVSRPRFIVWTVTVVFFLAAFVITALGVTSTYWFCSSVCHSVQDDAINQYNRSTHAKVSCMSCHMPVNADPVTYVIHKAEALGELYLTATGNYELPLNKGSHLALSGFSTEHCTQCHTMSKQQDVPEYGIKIDHKIHAQEGIRCTWCHNRVAHNIDGYTNVGIDPKTNKVSETQSDFMSMDGCFRCHTLEGEGVKSDCDMCHSAIPNPPATHRDANFITNHVELADAQGERILELSKEPKEESEHDVGGPSDTAEMPKSIKEVNNCYICHRQDFCTDCHQGTSVPKAHDGSAESNVNSSCTSCHGTKRYETATDKTTPSVHATHMNISSFIADGGGCVSCHPFTDLVQGSATVVKKQVDPAKCTACHDGLKKF